MSDALLLGFYAVVLLIGWRLERWLTRREARHGHGDPWRDYVRMQEAARLVGAHRRAAIGDAYRRTNGPNLRPDVLRVPGDTDAEIIDYLTDQRRRTW